MKDEEKNENEELSIVDENFSDESEGKIKKLKEELKECRKRAEEYLAGWQRSKADFINARKDEEKKTEAIVKYANERLIYELLNVLNSLENALAEPSLEEKWKTGFRHIRNQLMQIIRGYGVDEMETRGQKFNPEEHESIGEEEVSDAVQDQIILEELQKGYKMHDKVLRPAKVKLGVYKNKK